MSLLIHSNLVVLRLVLEFGVGDGLGWQAVFQKCHALSKRTFRHVVGGQTKRILRMQWIFSFSDTTHSNFLAPFDSFSWPELPQLIHHHHFRHPLKEKWMNYYFFESKNTKKKLAQLLHSLICLKSLVWEFELWSPPDLPGTLESLRFQNFRGRLGHWMSRCPLTRLICSSKFNHSLSELSNYACAHTLTHLDLGRRFDQSLEPLTCLSVLSSLTLGKEFSQSIEPLSRCPRLHTLRLSDKFNQTLDELEKSSSLRRLFLGFEFSQPLDHLPPHLTHLIIEKGGNFNCPLNHLPSSLTHLSLDCDFNHPVDQFPSGLNFLIFGLEFSQPLDQLLRRSSRLKFLHLPRLYLQGIGNSHWPPSLIHLTCCRGFSSLNHRALQPQSLQRLRVTDGFAFQTKKTPTLSLFGAQTVPFDFSALLMSIVSPVDPWIVTHLTLSDSFNSPLTPLVFPLTLIELHFGDRHFSLFNQPLPLGVLTPQHEQLRLLSFGGSFNQVIVPGSLPSHLKTLVLGKSFNQPLSNHNLPCFLEILDFDLAAIFSHPLSQLPSRLLSLLLPEAYRHPLIDLPQSLMVLRLGQRIPSSPSSVIPSNLLHLKSISSEIMDRTLLPPKLLRVSLIFSLLPNHVPDNEMTN